MFDQLFSLMGMMFLLIVIGFILRRAGKITEQGKACAEEIRDRIRRSDAELSALLPPDHEAQLLALLGELSDIMEKGLPPC